MIISKYKRDGKTVVKSAGDLEVPYDPSSEGGIEGLMQIVSDARFFCERFRRVEPNVSLRYMGKGAYQITTCSKTIIVDALDDDAYYKTLALML